MVQDSNSDAERQTNSLQGGKTCVEDIFYNCQFNNPVHLSVLVFLPPYQLRHYHSLLPSLFASFSSGDLELSLRQRAASNKKADRAEVFRLLMTDAKMFYFFPFGGDK